ncbi:MAG: DoxX family protein [Pseudomonadota bacterium]
MTTAAATLPGSTVSGRKGLHIALWIVQGLLAVAFGFAGVMKLTTPYDQLAQNMAWAVVVPEALVRFIGLSELAGALGLVLPGLTRIKTGLTALAALGLTSVMVLAAAFHVYLGETAAMGPSLVLGSLAAFVAWGRYRRAPITPRA